MPAKIIHEIMDRITFGRAYPEVHRYMDVGAREFGLWHRFIHGHDIKTVEYITRVMGREAGMAAYLHILDDWNPFLMLVSLPFYLWEFASGKG